LDATKVAAELLKVGVNGFLGSIEVPTAIVSSPIRRTMQTAEIIGKQLGIAVDVEEDIAEISFGDWDGHTNKEVAEKWPNEFEEWKGDIAIAPPGNGESLIDFDARVEQGRRRILSKYEGQTVIAVSHVMPIRGFIRTAAASDWEAYWRFSVGPCSITVLRFWGDEAAEITCINYQGHQ
jgi:probable phosphoglycerate mutase